MTTIAELLEASRNREQALDEMIDMLKNSTPVERLRFAVNICPILDKGDTSEAFTLLAKVCLKESDSMLDAFRALSKEDRLRATAKALALVEQDKMGTPRNRRIPTNGEPSVTDVVVNVVQAAKVPMTRAQILTQVQAILPTVKPDSVQGIISGKKADGTFRHHEEEQAYSMA